MKEFMARVDEKTYDNMREVKHKCNISLAEIVRLSLKQYFKK